VHWDIDDGPVVPVHVSVVRRSGITQRRGTVVHRVDLRDDEVVVRDGIRTTTVARTLLDVAAQLRGRRLEQVVRRAARRRRFDLVEVEAVIARHRRAAGATELTRLLASLSGRGTDDARSRLEVAFAQLCDDFGLPRPQINAIIMDERVDFSWPGSTLVVESDGFEFHAMPTAFTADRRRDQRLTLAGYTVVRFTYDQVIGDRAGTARAVSALLSRCRSS
jgi:very-short-patch-repair endonuclease